MSAEIDEVERLFQRFIIGDRVRASLEMFNANTGETVAEGTIGTVERTRVAGCVSLVSVKWDGSIFDADMTSVQNLDPEPKIVKGTST